MPHCGHPGNEPLDAFSQIILLSFRCLNTLDVTLNINKRDADEVLSGNR